MVSETVSHAISRLNGQLQIRRVVPAGVDDVPALVLRGVFAEGGHPLAKQILRADDQPKLLARTEHQTGNSPGPGCSRLGHRTSGRPDAALRAGLASSMLVGLVVGRRLVGVPIIAEADTETLVALVAPAIQRVLT
jgi:hypothetical protein